MADENDPLNVQGSQQPPDAAQQDPVAGNSLSDASSDPGQTQAASSGGGQEEADAAASLSTAQSPQIQEPSDQDDLQKVLKQGDIDQLLSQVGSKTQTTERPQPAPKDKPREKPPRAEADLAQGDVEFLLKQAQRALESIDADPEGARPQGITSFRFEEFAGAPASTEYATLDLINDVDLDLKIELGRTRMYLEDLLRLRKGSVVPLDKLAGDPVDIYVNNRLIARGEVLVLNDNFCVRVGELIAGLNPNG
jgi:flagellar motor switch protein FliN/FliY